MRHVPQPRRVAALLAVALLMTPTPAGSAESRSATTRSATTRSATTGWVQSKPSRGPDRGDSFAWPVNAPVLETFRAPLTTYGAGHRGISFLVMPGTPVASIGNGTVTFAGAINGRLFATISHPGGLRSTLSYLADATVVVGDVVSRGQIIGHCTQELLLTLRRGTTYLDPARFIGRVHARLIARRR